MRYLNQFFSVTALSLMLISCRSSEPTDGRTSSPPNPQRQVNHRLQATMGDDARVVDDLGRTVILRGVNVNGLGEYYQEFDDLPSTLPLTEDDFAEMATLGFNVVRLIVSWSRLEPQRGVFDHAYIERIAETVNWARAHDLYVLLDMHQDAWGPWVFTPDGVSCPPPTQAAVGWDGAPQWATAQLGGIFTCRLALREASLVVQTSFQNFYLDNDGIQTELVKTWATLAQRFSADPIIAGYDLLNEPNPGFTAGVNDYLLLGRFYDRALQAIRAAESAVPGGFSHIGFFEPEVLVPMLNLPTPSPAPGFSADGNLVYAPHLYNESINPTPATIEDGFTTAANAASSHGTTFFSGEWAWFGDPAIDAPKVARYAAQEDAYRIGGAWWGWKGACGDPHRIQSRGNRPDCASTASTFVDGLVTSPREITTILDRAYPRAAPGTLTSIQADIASGSLAVTGKADRAAVAADLWLPARCAKPTVSGLNVGPATSRAVPGGWRISVPIPAADDYRIDITCAKNSL